MESTETMEILDGNCYQTLSLFFPDTICKFTGNLCACAKVVAVTAALWQPGKPVIRHWGAFDLDNNESHCCERAMCVSVVK